MTAIHCQGMRQDGALTASFSRTYPQCFCASPSRARSVTMQASKRFGQCILTLDKALLNLMDTADYDHETALKSSYRAPKGALPRLLPDRGNTTFTKTDYERIMGTNDLVGIEYLENGMQAAAAVARVLVRDPDTTVDGNATGFLVSPRLLLTNRHVLENIDIARVSTVQFNYERDTLGVAKEVADFKLLPDELFIVGDEKNEDADFALVAVAPFSERRQVPLSTFGYLRLDGQPGKVQKKEFITIIQHPNGELKKISVRENEVIEKGENDVRPVLLYRSDTAPGSSGSPCFNDQWQVVALHSKGVPKTLAGDVVRYVLKDSNTPITKDAFEYSWLDDGDILWEANLGVRISFIVDAVRRSAAASHPLVQDFLADTRRGGAPVQASDAVAAGAFGGAGVLEAGRVEAPVRRFGRGYDPDFLGVSVPLPLVGPKALRYGRALVVPGTGSTELKYTHFSVIMNEFRRLAFVSAANIDGAAKTNVKRRKTFFADARIGAALQTDEDVYYEPGPEEDEFFDRGHLTRRDDVCWGSKADAKAASDESFAFPNVAPQHKAFNQSARNGVWGQLENYVLDQATEEDVKVSVFNGPIFAFTDLLYKDVPIPKEFFKVIVVADPASKGKLRATAYIASQAELVADAVLMEQARKYNLKKPVPIGNDSVQGRAVTAAAGSSLQEHEELPIFTPFDGFNRDGRKRFVDVHQVTIEEIEKRTGLIFVDVVRDGSVVPVPASGGGDGSESAQSAAAPAARARKAISSLNDVVL